MYHRFYARSASVKVNGLYLTKGTVLELALYVTFRVGKLKTSEGHVHSEVMWSESLTQSLQFLMRDPKITFEKVIHCSNEGGGGKWQSPISISLYR